MELAAVRRAEAVAPVDEGVTPPVAGVEVAMDDGVRQAAVGQLREPPGKLRDEFVRAIEALDGSGFADVAPRQFPW